MAVNAATSALFPVWTGQPGIDAGLVDLSSIPFKVIIVKGMITLIIQGIGKYTHILTLTKTAARESLRQIFYFLFLARSFSTS